MTDEYHSHSYSSSSLTEENNECGSISDEFDGALHGSLSKHQHFVSLSSEDSPELESLSSKTKFRKKMKKPKGKTGHRQWRNTRAEKVDHEGYYDIRPWCNVCFHEFETFDVVLKHQGIAHKKMAKFSCVVQAPNCGRLFESVAAMRLHDLRRHNRSSTYVEGLHWALLAWDWEKGIAGVFSLLEKYVSQLVIC